MIPTLTHREITMQESSFLLGLRYIVATLSLYDEYSNDVLDMPEGSCFPRFYSSFLYSTCFEICTYWWAWLVFDRPKYRRKKIEISRTTSHSNSFSRTKSLTKTISRTISLTNNIAELKPFEVLFFTDIHLTQSCFYAFADRKPFDQNPTTDFSTTRFESKYTIKTRVVWFWSKGSLFATTTNLKLLMY